MKMNKLSPQEKFVKRAVDLTVATTIMLLLGWLILFLLALSSLDTGKFGFFTQQRIGRNGKLFNLLKIRTMKNRKANETTVTVRNDPRITHLGKLLRKTKADELPQVINVLKGEMSIVGPRPDVPGFADLLEGEDRIVLTVRPGITGLASLAFRDEEEILLSQTDPEMYNKEVLYPRKVEINKYYIHNYSILLDLKCILCTVLRMDMKHGD